MYNGPSATNTDDYGMMHMPNLSSHRETLQNRVELGIAPPPLTKQLIEEQNASDMRAFYQRDLDNFVHVQNKSNERLGLKLTLK